MEDMAHTDHQAPHAGAMIEKIRKEKMITKSEFARRLGQTPAAVNAIIRQGSLRMYRLWDVSLALNYDFFAEISNHLPEGTEVGAGDRNAARIAELEQQVRDLQKEVAIYEKILERK